MKTTSTCFPVAFLFAIAGSFIANTVRGDVGPENTVVVVNADSWASLSIANEYVHLRKIHAGNVVYLSGLPDFERLSVDDFRQQILTPVFETIHKRGLKEQIDCIAYSSDLPYAIDVRGDVGKNKLPRVITPTASINGLTYLHEQVLAKDVNYLQLNANRYMRLPISRQDVKPLTLQEQQRVAQASALISQQKWKEAEVIFGDLAKQHPRQPTLLYNQACCLARLEKADEAIAALAKSVAAGWSNDRHAAADADLISLRKRKDFQDLLKKMQQQTFQVQPTAGFRSTYRWNSRGEKVDDESGRRYLLSTMLAVTSGRGNSYREAVDSLRRSVAADATRPAGTFYFLVNGDIRAKTRQGAFRSAVAGLKKLGMRGEIVEGTLPQNKQDVLGAMVGRASFNWPASKSSMLPGAISEHLTSLGGVMRQRGGQTPLTEFLRHGAALSSGTVTEPYAIQAKFPFPFLHVHYARGATAVEAFYQSVYGPYQLLIVGDPLCRPWAQPPKVTIEGLQPGATVSVKTAVTPRADFAIGDVRKIARYELFIDGRRVANCKQGDESLSFDASGLADGSHEARIVAVTDDPLETQGRATAAFLVNSHKRKVLLTSRNGDSVKFGQPLLLQVDAPGAKKVDVSHNGRTLATIEGPSGEAMIDTGRLGLGPIEITAVAHYGDKQSDTISAPLKLKVVAPASLPPLNSKDENLAAGLQLSIDGGKPVVIEDTYPRDWLAKHASEPKKPFTLESVFDVTADDVYQFQLNSNCNVEVRVDGKLLPQPTGGGWKFLPVALQAGRHRVSLTGVTVPSARLQIRFGGRGAQSLDGKRFYHEVKAE